MIKKYFVLSIYFLFSAIASSSAQSTYQIGFLPSLTLTKKINPKWKVSLNAQARFSAYEGEFSDSDTFQDDFDYVLTDISALANRKLGLNTSVVAGYLVRFRNNEVHNRIFQQFIITKKYNLFALSHRFVTDQTFRPNQDTEFRLRYRLAFDRPLQGDKLNDKEFYLKVQNEYLIALQQKEWENEVRIIPFLGYALTDKKKIEIGMDYRISSFGDDFLNSNFWTTINYYWSF